MGNLNCFAVVVPGLESIAADELAELSAHEIKAEKGGVAFTTTMDGLCRINLRSRCATRILVRLARFRALSFPELYNKAKKVEWGRYIGAESAISVKASCSGSKLMHSDRGANAVADAIADKLGFQPDRSDSGQQILLRIDNNDCTLSIDTSGERLDRRGYRLHAGRAPLRETIAAATLRWMEWQADEPLVTPMCGSGTFAIEAAWMAEKRAPGLEHVFPFVRWPSHREKRWQRAVAKASAMLRDAEATIIASDIDAAILAQARRNAATAGVSDLIRFEQQDVRAIQPPGATPGLIVCNPPYGKRIGSDVRGLYAALGHLFVQRFPGWRMVVIVPDRGCEQALGLTVKRRMKLSHGGTRVQALHL